MTVQIQGYRLSPPQAHLWLLQRNAPAAFHAQAVIGIEGALDAGLLKRGLDRIVARHEILRTTYHHTPGIPLPVQVIGEQVGIEWRDLDLQGEEEPRAVFERIRHEESIRPFELDRGPLLRGVLARLADLSYRLILTLPSMCADRGTLGNLFAEVAVGYGSSQDGALRSEDEEIVQYLQFSEWQHQILEADEEEGAAFWRRQDLTEWVARLPFERPAGPAVPFLPRVVSAGIETDGMRKVEELATVQGASDRAVLLAAWLALLVRLTGPRRQVASVVIDGRKYDELLGSLGLFSRSVPVALALSLDLTFADAVGRVHEALADAEEWQDYFQPEEPGLGVPVGFELVRLPSSRRERSVTFSLLEQRACIERSVLALACLAADGALRLDITYDANRLDALQAERIGQRLRTLLSNALARPEAPLGDLDIVGDEERRWLVEELNRTRADHFPDACIHELFATQAAATPDAVAVAFDDLRLNYAELNGRANQLAWYLRSLGVGPETTVAVLLERSAATLIAILGVLKAGGAYVPLDTAYPVARLAYMLDDARPAVVLTQGALVDLLPASVARVVCLDRDGGEIDRQSRLEPPSIVHPANLAYVIYTSGSTGLPKGVMVAHRGLANYLSWAARAYGVDRGEAAPVHSPVSFDLTVTSLFAPLLAGRTVVLLPEREGVQALGAALQGAGDFSLVKITPAHLDLLRHDLEGSAGWARVRALILGGEALLGESLSFWRARSPETRLINEYGPTETVVGCCAYEIPSGSELSGPVPIGRPIANSRLFVLDGSGRLAPAGVAGELYIGGDGVARGYLNRPDLTAERFVPDPFSGAGERLYRTGDLARHLPDGNLEFLGRNDRQVKIRGIRIELGEIEAALAQDPRVREVVVVDREDAAGGSRRLVAYLVFARDGGPPPGIDHLRGQLASRLPEYMIPTAYVALDRLPLTTNGKVDRAALPPPGSERPDLGREYVAPDSEEERLLAEVWMDALNVDKVGVHDNFFALGGDSMRSVRVVNLARDKGFVFTVQDLFRQPTIAGLVSALGLRATAGGADDRELAALLDELEALPEEEVRGRLEQLQAREATD